MLKAGSYLFPGRSFSNLRDYLMGNASLLVADCTGPTPKQAKKHGFKQTTYGKYLGHGSYVPQGRFYDKRLIAMWKSQPYRRLGFRFGYGDNAANGHLAIWRKSGDTKTQIPSEKKE
jgi:hypothetical protein